MNPVTTLKKNHYPHFTGEEIAIQRGEATYPGGNNPGLCDCSGFSGKRAMVWPQPQHLLGSLWQVSSLLDISFPICKMGIRIPSLQSYCGGLSKLMDLQVFCNP